VKRATPLIVSFLVLAATALSAGVKPTQEPKRSPSAAQAQQAGEHSAAAQSPAPEAAAPAQAGAGGSAHAGVAESSAPGAAQGSPGVAEGSAHPGVGQGSSLAAEHEKAGEHEAAQSPWADIARLFNFAVLAGALVYLLRSPFGAFLEGRKVQIRKSLTDAAATREDATRQLAVIDQKLQALPGDLEALKRLGAAEIAAEEERIRQAADIERQRMVENGKREIERHGQIAERQLTQRAGELAVSLATERVKRKINDADQARLVDRYLEQVRPEVLGS
jgi:F0F1-type ATP synthase membrane subunit b/b'